MNSYMRLGAALLAASSLAACATITRGTQQKFEIKSEPPGADVKLSTGMSCTTPCHLKLRRKDEFVARIAKAGYEPVEVQVESKMHGGGGAALAGNVLAGGLIGGVLDGTNGSLRDLRPNPIEVTLKPLAAPAPTLAPGDSVTAAAAPSPSTAPADAATPPTPEAPAAAAGPAASPGTSD